MPEGPSTNRVIQSSFNVGEVAPALYARTDVAKYHSAAALLRNFFVDYRGGASTRAGTQYVLQCYKSSTPVRLIPFAASVTVEYVLEFGDRYIRFFYNRSPVLETGFAYTVASSTTLTIPGHNYSVGDWFYAVGDYFAVTAVSGNNVTYGPIGPGAVTPISASGTSQRIYTLASPYAAADLALIKFAQNVNELVICHPNYVPYALTLNTATNWTILPINFGTAAQSPSGLTVVTTLAGGSVRYSYTVTSVDASGEESGQATPVPLNGYADLRVSNGTNKITWTAVPGATSYNVYKSDVSYYGAVPAGVPYGFIGNTNGTEFDDSNISPDFSETPPILQNPFTGSGISRVNVTTSGTYTSVPGVIAGGVYVTAATLAAILQVTAQAISAGGSGYNVGDQIALANNVTLVVANVGTTGSGASTVTGVVTALAPLTNQFVNVGYVSSGSVPTNPVAQVSTTGAGTGFSANLTWGVGQVIIQNGGAGFTAAPSLTFLPSGATATAVLGSASAGNPTVPAYFQQRQFLGGSTGAPATFNLSQPGNYNNYNVSSPVQSDDAISGSLISGQLQQIKSAVSTSAGLIVFTDKSTWLINGGSAGSAVSPSAIVANPQSSTGASDLPPIVANYDILYVQAKGSIVRDSTYNIYANVYTGSDISVLSSHLFYGYDLLQWTYAEEPFKVVWAVRNDGVLLSLTFLKEQDFIGWAHSDTQGLFKSVMSITETGSAGTLVDGVYTVVQRTVGGVNYQYIERMADRSFTTTSGCWCVDAGLQYFGALRSTFSGARHLAGLTVTGLADGKIIPPFVMPASGAFTIPTAAMTVTIGLAFTAQLQTLAIDTGEPTVQGKQKKISNVILRAQNTLGLKAGSTFNSLVPMKDFQLGNIGSMSNAPVTDLVTSDAKVFLDPTYNSFGQYCLQQDQPYPATILGIMPEYAMGA